MTALEPASSQNFFNEKKLLDENLPKQSESTQALVTSSMGKSQRPEVAGFALLERLRWRFFSISREPRTSRSHVTKFRRQVCGLKLVFGREEGGLQVSHLLQGFFAFILKQFA